VEPCGLAVIALGYLLVGRRYPLDTLATPGPASSRWRPGSRCSRWPSGSSSAAAAGPAASEAARRPARR
jgi:hypothetical protein